MDKLNFETENPRKDSSVMSVSANCPSPPRLGGAARPVLLPAPGGPLRLLPASLPAAPGLHLHQQGHPSHSHLQGRSRHTGVSYVLVTYLPFTNHFTTTFTIPFQHHLHHPFHHRLHHPFHHHLHHPFHDHLHHPVLHHPLPPPGLLHLRRC